MLTTYSIIFLTVYENSYRKYDILRIGIIITFLNSNIENQRPEFKKLYEGQPTFKHDFKQEEKNRNDPV